MYSLVLWLRKSDSKVSCVVKRFLLAFWKGCELAIALISVRCPRGRGQIALAPHPVLGMRLVALAPVLCQLAPAFSWMFPLEARPQDAWCLSFTTISFRAQQKTSELCAQARRDAVNLASLCTFCDLRFTASSLASWLRAATSLPATAPAANLSMGALSLTRSPASA